MRTFENWEIINRIEKSPKEYIKQRNCFLFSTFLWGYEVPLLEIQDEEKLKEKYSDIPSFDEFIRKKYQAENIGTHNYMSVIQFFSEDERDCFHHYISLLKEYENTFPVEEKIIFLPKKKPTFQLKELFKGMKLRFRMYFRSLAELRAFLDGYFLCKEDYQIPLTDFERKIQAFTRQISCMCLSLEGDFVTWDRKYQYDRSWQSYGAIEDKVLEDFWQDLEVFVGEEIE